MVGGFHYEALFVGEVCYLMPSLGFSVLLALLSRRWGFCEILKFPGVLVHEMLHFTVGFVTMAHPISISSIPRLVNGRLVRGSVGFVGLNWLNAWLTALAPLLALPIMFVLARWRLSGGAQHFVLMDVCIWVLFAPHWLYCWPSRADWKLVLISWPLGVILLSIFSVWAWCFA